METKRRRIDSPPGGLKPTLEQETGIATNNGIGSQVWAIPEGYIPGSSTGPEDMKSHETICFLNASDRDATVEITAYFSDREPVGPYELVVEARRTLHLQVNDLEDPEPIPTDTDYATVIRSNVPLVVQHSRLDSRQSANALLSTMAYPVEDPGGR